ncbi:hypothetical protein GOP47_0031181 [Adiantum capillus-veneris]|nr:hypothetical protein GOP47_0031181 [Adiantum capillus-veneris]
MDPAKIDCIRRRSRRSQSLELSVHVAPLVLKLQWNLDRRMTSLHEIGNLQRENQAERNRALDMVDL